MTVDRRKWNQQLGRAVGELSKAMQPTQELMGMTADLAARDSLRDAIGCVEGAIQLLFAAERQLPASCIAKPKARRKAKP